MKKLNRMDMKKLNRMNMKKLNRMDMKKLNRMNMKKLNRMNMKKLNRMDMNGSFSSILTIMICAFLMFSVLPHEVISVENPPTDRGDGVLENSGDWFIEEGEDFQYSDETIVINGNITVNGTLTLTRCELVMNASYSTIRVAGDLILETTNISGNGSYYYFLVSGGIDMRDSHLFDMAGSSSFPYIGGLQLLTDDVFMEGGSIRDAEFTGLYVNADVILWNTSIIDNQYNVVVNGSTPEFINCTIRYPGSVNIFMFNGSNPILIEGEQAGRIMFDDELSSLGFGHTLHVHVTYENGTSIPGVTVTATSSGGEVSEKRTTDASGWVRNLVLPEETIYKSIPDKVYRPYRVTAEKYGLSVMDIVSFESDTTVEMILTGDYFGEALTRGDYNGDGYLDLVVGVPRNRTGLTTPGAVFVFLNDGGLELYDIDESMADLTIRGVQGTGFGSVLASGDINGDGFDDLLLSTPHSSENGGESGRVYFFFGNEAPAWNDLSDADFTFDGDPGSHFGIRLFTGNLNNDEFTDFIIGDDQKSYVYYSTANPDEDFNRVSEVYAAATSKGAADTTGEPISKIRQDDDDRYNVQHPNTPNNEMHITNFSYGELKGEVISATLWIQFTNDRYYGHNDHERSYIYYNVGDGWKESLRPRYNPNNWREERTWSYDLFADGVSSMEQLEQLELYLENTDGTNNSQVNNNIYFDYIAIHVEAVPKGANHTLEAGNLSSGDVNGDGYPDLIISDISGQTVYFGGPLGLSAPTSLEIKKFEGNRTRIMGTGNSLSLSKIGQFENGNFDDGWDHWTFVANSAGEKDAVLRLLTEDVGDWKVSPYSGAPTGSYGDDADQLNGEGGDSSGKLRSDAFYVDDEVEAITFWYRWKVMSFDRNEGMNLKIYRESDDEVLITIDEWMAPSDSQNYEIEDYVNVSLVDLRGETVYLAMETIGGDGQYDDGLFQIDDVDLVPSYYNDNGTFVSDWITLEANLTFYTPWWTGELNNGTLSVKFRTDPGVNWNDTSESQSGEAWKVNGSSDRIQYRVEMTNDGSDTPMMSNLSIAYQLQGQILPLSLSTEYGFVAAADLNGDGMDDLLFHDDQGGRGQGIDIFYGDENLSHEYNASGIQDLYSGDVAGFSVIDLESDGKEELCLIGNSTRIVDSNSDVLWERADVASRIAGDVASDPLFHLNTGRIYFIPSHDLDIRVLTISTPSSVDPGEKLSINVTLGNIGTLDIEDLTLYLNITADGYSHQDSQPVSLDSMSGDSYNFPWDVPAKEGVEYVVTAEVTVADDRVPGNNNLSKPTTSKQHGIRLTTSDAAASAHGGDDLGYSIAIENIGTFETENVSLASVLPQDWTGEYRYADLPVDFIIVRDSVELTFSTRSPAGEEQGDFIINLTATAETAISSLDLTATILRPDLVVEEITLYRGDGVETNDIIHGVAGENEEFRIKVTNTGPTYAIGCTVGFYLDSDIVADWRNITLDAGETVWLAIVMRVNEGTMNVSASVDIDAEVPEMDEDNNELQSSFTIKDTQPVGDYHLSGKIVNIQGEGVELAEVHLEWDSRHVRLFTDENGTFQYTIPALNYTDTTVLHINATDGTNLTSDMIILYSEDGGKYLLLTLNQYLVELSGPDTVSSIETGETASIDVEVTNLGNTDATFIIEAMELPAGWSAEFTAIPDGKFNLSINESRTVEVVIRASSDPLQSMGYHRYFVTILVYSEIYPEANDSYIHGLQVEPKRSLLVSVVGDDAKYSQPYEEVTFQLSVENLGNIRDTFMPEVMGYYLEHYSFNITYAVLDIGESSRFTLNFTMPLVEIGTAIELEVGSTDVQTTNALVTTTALDFYSVQGDIPWVMNAKLGDALSLTIGIINSGNLPEIIDIIPWSSRTGMVAVDGQVELDMGEETDHTMLVSLPGDALSGEVIILTINLTTGGSFYLNLSMEIVVLETYGMSLTLMESTIIPGIDFTTYSYDIDAVNTGNGMNTFHFKAEGSHPHYFSLPAPVDLLPGEHAVINARVIVPINKTGVVDNYLVATDGDHDFEDLNLRILSYSMELDIGIVTSQDSEGYRYAVAVKNNGTRFERITLVTNLPKVDSYDLTDKRWGGGTNKDVLELSPGETESFTLTVKTPELKKYWGGDLSVTLNSDSKRSQTLTLPKPPIPVLGTTLPDTITFEDTLSFTGSQSYWDIVEYLWDFGDGNTDNSTTVSHSYKQSGEYTLTLTVIDDVGFNATKSITIVVNNIDPIAMIITNPSNRTVELGQPIELDGSFSQDRDGEIVSYNWDFGYFGDFYEGKFPVIEHSYDQIGFYEVTLLVTDNMGASVNASITVQVVEKTTTGGDTKDPIEKVITDKISYIPGLLIIVVAAAGGVVFFHKRSMIEHVKEKIREQEGTKR